MQRAAVLLSYATALAFVVASILLQGIQAVNVFLPSDFEQCSSATIGIGDSQGNVSILIREEGYKKPIVNISLPLNTTSWNWTAVSIPAGANFSILVTDRSPKKKTKLSQSFTQSTVDDSTTNDTSCLPAHDTKKKGNNAPSNGADDGDGIGIGQGGPHQPPHKIKTAEVSIIAGVLGGLLLALLLLILLMCWRRRRESKLAETSEHASKDTILAHRIGVMGQRLDRHQVVTLFGEDGREEGQAILGREGDAGWSYMSRIVPGLQTTPFTADTDDPHYGQSPSRTGRRLKTKRYDGESKDGELPSYGVSEYEKRALPRYAEDHRRTPSTYNAAMILTTRHDSQGSRLTFQPDMLDPNGMNTTPRHSARSLETAAGTDADDNEEVIVFRPASEQDAMLPRRVEDGEQTSPYSNAAYDGLTTTQQASSTALEPSLITNQEQGNTFHRRSRSEVSLRRPAHFSNEPLYR